jgi:RNA polymerase sigma-70 factor (ECF subfamily)
VEELGQILKCLSEEDRDLFFKRYVCNRSTEEIAKEKEMSPNLIYKRISRGKKKIKNHMECLQE